MERLKNIRVASFPLPLYMLMLTLSGVCMYAKSLPASEGALPSADGAWRRCSALE